jgi:hypothetical protein
MSDIPEKEGPQISGYTCKGCKHHHTRYWREPDGECEWDSGTSATCLLLGREIATYYGSSPSVPEWCPKPRADLPPTDAEVKAHPKVAALVEARRLHIDAVNAYNARLAEAKEALKRHDWSITTHDHFKAMHQQHREFVAAAEALAAALAAFKENVHD